VSWDLEFKVVKIGSGEVDEGGSEEEVKSVDRAMLYIY
jgi:hypothetical protein